MKPAEIQTTLPTQNNSRDVNTVMWEQLSEKIDAFCEAWDNDPPANISDYVPNDSPTLHQFVLVELIKVDMEYRWLKHDMPKPVEEYTAEFPELVQDGKCAIDLIYEEFHIRKQTEESPSAKSYYERFPNEREALQRLLGPETNHTVSTMVSGRKEPLFEPGESIDDFDLTLKLGKGAFASVFLARQRSMQRMVALKISRDKGTEHQTLARLDHPNIVRVYDQKVIPEKKIRLLYMQHIPGGTLHAVVDQVRKTPPTVRKGNLLLEVIDRELVNNGLDAAYDSQMRRSFSRMTWSQAVCHLGAKMAWGLDYAHHQGVLHRDIKPANILLSSDGEPKLADFNVSFSSKAEGANAAAFFGGSLAYMSPEQLEATNPHEKREPKDLDGRSDIYSLAVMLWELLTGKRPFPEEVNDDWTKMLAAFVTARQTGITSDMKSRLPSDMPDGMLEVLIDCLEFDATDRPGRAGDVARRLEMCLRPKAQRLFLPNARSWMQTMRGWPLSSFILSAVAPNVLLSAVNIHFNVEAVTSKLFNDDQLKFIIKVLFPVNGIAYPWGVIAGYFVGRPVIKAVHRLHQQHARKAQRRNQTKSKSTSADSTETKTKSETPPLDLPRMRKRSLRMGAWVSLITFALWVSSGFTIPYFVYHGIEDPSKFLFNNQLMLFCSQALFGAIAATQVFFWMTYLNIHVYYPLLVSPDKNDEEDVTQLERIERLSEWMVYVAVAAPSAAIFLFLQFPDTSGTGLSRTVFGTITGVGFVASGLAFWILKRIQNGVTTLSTVLGATDQSGTWSPESTESFATGTR